MNTDQEKRPPGGGTNRLWQSTHDWLTRAAVILVFAFLAFVGMNGAFHAAINWGDRPLDQELLSLTARISSALFLALVAATTVTRLRPIRKAAGIQPRVSALLGTFLLTSLVLLPPAQLPPISLAISSALVVVGTSLSFAALRWLGKSFSIMAEARRLVTNGPYAFVRHPLYVCEEIAAIGILIQVISPVALIIVLTHGLFQFRRVLNEEKVLRASFPEYESYAVRTPRLIPRLGRLAAMRESAAL